ncbi:serine hydrolase domain-containing protein [Amycolatopsis thermoflava]
MCVPSVAKAFSAATALELESRGRPGLDDTVGRWLDGFPPQWSEVSLRHCSGTPGGFRISATPAVPRRAAGVAAGPAAPPALLGYLGDPDLEFRPGVRYSYSNSDNILVGLDVRGGDGRALRGTAAAPGGPATRPDTHTSLPRAAPRCLGRTCTATTAPKTCARSSPRGGAGRPGATPADLVRFAAGYRDLLHPRWTTRSSPSVRAVPSRRVPAPMRPVSVSSVTTPASAESTGTPATPRAPPSSPWPPTTGVAPSS